MLLTRQAEELGCRGALLLPPFYYKNPSEDGLLAYFNEVIQRVGGDIRIYLYNFPQQSAVPFSVDLIARLLKAFPGKVKGVKDSSGNYDNGRAYVENFARDGLRFMPATTRSASAVACWAAPAALPPRRT